MRNRDNVFAGAPDIKAAGGMTLGPAVKDTSLYPTDATTELKKGLNHEPGGFISEDGLTQTIDRNTEKIKDWNGDTVRVVQTEHGVTVKATFLESANAAVLRAAYGDQNVKIDGAKGTASITLNGDELEHRSLNFQMKDGKDRGIRVFIPDAQPISVGDVTFVRNDVIKYELEFECLADAEGRKMLQFFTGLQKKAPETTPGAENSGNTDETDAGNTV